VTVAAIPTSTEVTCDDCGTELKPKMSATCGSCFAEAVLAAADEVVEARPDHGEAIRDWAARRFLLGQISKEVRAELELCAEDIEVGHG
jgi:hypothetical protein